MYIKIYIFSRITILLFFEIIWASISKCYSVMIMISDISLVEGTLVVLVNSWPLLYQSLFKLLYFLNFLTKGVYGFELPNLSHSKSAKTSCSLINKYYFLTFMDGPIYSESDCQVFNVFKTDVIARIRTTILLIGS